MVDSKKVEVGLLKIASKGRQEIEVHRILALADYWALSKLLLLNDKDSRVTDTIKSAIEDLGNSARGEEKQTLGEFYIRQGTRMLTAAGLSEEDISKKIIGEDRIDAAPQEKRALADNHLKLAISLFRDAGLSELGIAHEINTANGPINQAFGEKVFTGTQVRRALEMYEHVLNQKFDECLKAGASLEDVAKRKVIMHERTALQNRLNNLDKVYAEFIMPDQNYSYNNIIMYSHTAQFDVEELDAALMEVTIEDLLCPQIVQSAELEQERTLVTVKEKERLWKLVRPRLEVLVAPIGKLAQQVYVAAGHCTVAAGDSYQHTIAWFKRCIEYAQKKGRELKIDYELQKELLAEPQKA